MVAITWTTYKLKRFKHAYAECTTDRFVFEGHEFLKDYAKYLIEYLEREFKPCDSAH